MELAAQLVIQPTRIDFAHQLHHVVFQGIDAGEFHVDAHFHVTFHAMPHVLQGLLLEFLGKHEDYALFHLGEDDVGVTALVESHRTDDALEHKEVLHLGDIGDQDVFLAQVFHLLLAAAVTIHDAATFQLMEVLQVAK